MQANLKDILSHLSTEVDQDTLLQYLQGKLTAQQQHEVEKYMMDNEFMADAWEGLQTIKDQQQVSLMVDQLNRDLKKKTQKKRVQKEKLRLKFDPWPLIAVVLILLLVAVAYMVIHYLR